MLSAGPARMVAENEVAVLGRGGGFRSGHVIRADRNEAEPQPQP